MASNGRTGIRAATQPRPGMEQTLFRSHAGAKSPDALRKSNNSVTPSGRFQHLCWTHRTRVRSAGSGRSRQGHRGIAERIASPDKSFKYVVEIAMSNTNVWPRPIALRAPRVYLRCCDARPDARVDHLQAPPPL